jgi:exoribonuclease R
MIDREIAPKEFLDTPEAFDKTYFTASIKRWNASHSHPSGFVTGKLGQMGEIPIETEALLVDAGVTWSEFAEDVLEDLPATVRYVLTCL